MSITPAVPVSIEILRSVRPILLPGESVCPIAGASRYLVTDQGYVLSVVRDRPRRLKGIPQTKGYLQVQLFLDDKSSSRQLVHTIVMESYVGPRPVDRHNRPFHIHHIDGDQQNNALANLTYLSADDHIQVKRLTGGFTLTPETVWTARCKLLTVPFDEVANGLVQTTGISQIAASQALRGRSWSSIPFPSNAVRLDELANALGVDTARAAEMLTLAQPAAMRIAA